ncbi:MAG: efflux RND transporter periplasmic adaptor subunit [Planctomycetota bacterium]|nr:efflux RND transporter periplasmic adaptor subunit [Planctomycetota bacterium]
MSTRNLPGLAAVFLPLLLMLLLMMMAACDSGTDPSSAPSASPAGAAAPTNHVDIPASVRQNLGITFAKVERRAVARTLRLPGRFELLPNARREHRAAVPGTVELLVGQYEVIKAGTVLYRIDSPHWRQTQRELADAHAALRLAQAGADSIGPLSAAHEQHHAEVERAVELWTARVANLEQLRAAGGARGDEIAQARAALASIRVDLAETLEKEAELVARRTEAAASLEAARARLDFLFQAAATMTGLSVGALQAADPASLPAEARPRWATLPAIEVRAPAPGVVETLHAVSGGVVDQHAPVLSTVQPELVRFRAVALQSDLLRLADAQPATVVPAQGSMPVDAPAFAGTLTLAPTADPERRTLEVVLAPGPATQPPGWARAGVAAFLEVVTGPTGSGTRDELAIPLRCVARDGTKAIIFRRDPANPDKAIRMEADLGLDDGRWVVIRSGVAEDNEIVLEGVYQLMVATSGSITKGGHFHPDGTFHEGDD